MKLYNNIGDQWRFKKCASDFDYCTKYREFTQIQLPNSSTSYTVEFYNENDTLITGIASHQNVDYSVTTISLFDFVNAGNPCFYAKIYDATNIYYTDMYCWTGEARCRKLWSICNPLQPLVFDIITATGAKTDYIANISNDIKVVTFGAGQALETDCDVIAVNQKNVSVPMPFTVLCSSTLLATQNLAASNDCNGNIIEIESKICKTINSDSNVNFQHFRHKFLLGSWLIYDIMDGLPQPNYQTVSQIQEFWQNGDTIINIGTNVTFTANVTNNPNGVFVADNPGNDFIGLSGVFVNVSQELRKLKEYSGGSCNNNCVIVPKGTGKYIVNKFFVRIWDAPADDDVWDFQIDMPAFLTYSIGDIFQVQDIITGITYNLTCVNNWSAAGLYAFPFHISQFPGLADPNDYFSYFTIKRNGIPIEYEYEYTLNEFNVYNSTQSIYSNKTYLCATIQEEEPSVDIKYNSFACKAYKSSITEAININVNELMPPFAITEISHILLRGEVYINGEKYIYKGGKISANINNIKAKRVNIPLEDCSCEKNFYC